LLLRRQVASVGIEARRDECCGPLGHNTRTWKVARVAAVEIRLDEKTRLDRFFILREPVDDDNDGRRAQEAEREEEAVPAGARMVDAVIWARALARRRRAREGPHVLLFGKLER